jgi:glyoxylase-like metal-dependent hydrolase (beta-lactamase superfamily II)
MRKLKLEVRSKRVEVALAIALAVGAAKLLAQQGGPQGPAMVELVGSWTMVNDEERLIRIDPGPELGNFTGFPLNAAGRQKALAWNSTIQAIPEHQSRPHAGSYSMRGPNPSPHIGEIIDPITRRVIAYTLTGLFESANRTIWLDGRPHPSDYAERLWTGFSTGEWENGMLHVTTTHFKQMFQQRNGVAVSPYAVMHEYYIRHGDRLTLISQIEDPVYLEEPMIRTSTFRWNPGAREGAINQVDVAEEVPGLRQGDVPHYPLGATHPEYAQDNKLPFEATLGGRETLYPEYVEKLKTMDPNAPAAGGGGARPALLTTQAPKGRSGKEMARPYRPTYENKGIIEVLPVQGNVYMLAGGGSNVALSVGPSSLLVVDTNEAAMSDKILAAIRTISPLPIRDIINTSADPDHVGGNERFATSAGDAGANAFYDQAARVYSSENAYSRIANPKGGQALPSALWPTDAFAAPLKTLFATGEPLEMIHPASGHTDGDLMVFFRKSDVIVAGDLFSTDRYPVIDAARGGSLAGTLEALNRMIDIAVPEFNSMGGTRVIPGHGRICNEIDLVEYRDAMTIVADRVTQLILDGKTLDQVKAAGVTLDYDGVYGATSGEWTTDMFVEAVYKEIKANTAPWKARLLRNVPASDLQMVSTSRPTSATKVASVGKPGGPTKKGAGDPLEGRWVLNLFESSYEPASLLPYRREMVISANASETTHAVSSWRRPQGNGSPLSTYTYTAKFDGKPYPIPNMGKASVTLKRVDPNTIERSLDGADVGKETATWTLSVDKKTLRVVAKGTDATGVAYTSTQIYEKQ